MAEKVKLNAACVKSNKVYTDLPKRCENDFHDRGADDVLRRVRRFPTYRNVSVIYLLYAEQLQPIAARMTLRVRYVINAVPYDTQHLLRLTDT